MKKLALFALLALPLCLACDEDSPTGVSGAIQTDPVTIANGLATVPGTTWAYELDGKVYRDDFEWDNVYETIDEVPGPLTLDEVIALAANPPSAVLLEQEEGTLDWELLSATPVGDTLSCFFDSDFTWPTRGYYFSIGPGAERLHVTSAGVAYPGYNGANGLPLLSGELQPGDQFATHLLGDAWLHARVLGSERVSTPAGVFADALAIFYYIDLGAAGITGGGPGEILGYMRLLSYGTLHWVAGVGPVRGVFRDGISVGETEDAGWDGLVMALSASSALD